MVPSSVSAAGARPVKLQWNQTVPLRSGRRAAGRRMSSSEQRGGSPGRLRRAGPAVVAAVVAALALAAGARASDLTITGCECLVAPGNIVNVHVTYSNTTASDAQLFIELTLPNAKKFYLAPVGLVERPVPWITVPANTVGDPGALLTIVTLPDAVPVDAGWNCALNVLD